MKILIATALFPPDIAPPAPYVKELAARLSTNHDVRVLCYGTIPETVEEVPIDVIPKRHFAWFRLWLFTRTLFTLTRRHDVVLIQNAPSTELPAAFVGLFYKQKLQLQMSDQKVVSTGWRNFLHRFTCKRITCIVDTPLPKDRPEIIPFADYPSEAFAAYEKSWEQHLALLSTHFNTV